MPDRPLSIMQILPALDGGGVERGTLEVAEELVRRGYRSIVISKGGRLVAELERSGSEHVAMPIGEKSPRILGVIRPFRTVLREIRPDILHVRSRMPAWAAHFAMRGWRERERPFVVSTVHGLYSVNRYSRIMTRADRIIAISEVVRRYILENYPDVDSSRITLIHRGVSPQEFPHGYMPDVTWRDAFFAEFPLLRDRPIITLPGRLSRGKGHHDLIELMTELRARGLRACGLVVGGEEPRRKAYADEIRREVVRRGLDVLFAGHRSDIREIYAVSAVVLSLSRKPEAFGRTVVEGLSIGVPVVGYDHGGVGEILEALFPQGRVPVGDITALADCVQRCIDERPSIAPQSTFLKSAMLEKTIAMYEELASGDPSPKSAAVAKHR